MAKSASTTVQAPTISSIPALYAFDSRSTTWQSYRDRINFYFKANRINEDDDKKALFLWSVGDTTYNLLESLVSPKSLTSEDTEFTDLINLLDSHYNDTKNIMTSTYDFYSCYQKAGQTFTEWKAELCEKMRHCGFTTSSLKDKPQDRALRDMYVIGIKSAKIRQALLKEQDPDLEKTERIIQLAERLADDVRHFNGPVNNAEFSVAKLHQHQSKRQIHQQNNSSIEDDYKPCQTCGSNKHLRSTCTYREYTCNFCKRKGHLERVCRQKEEETSTNFITSSFKVNHVNQNESLTSHSTTISLCVNNYDISFEVDTGTTNTIINKQDWYKLGSPTLRPSKFKVKCYDNTSLTVKGECYVKVEYEKQIFNLPILIAHSTGPSLLGLQWIKILQLDLNHIVYGSNYAPRYVHKIYSEVKPQANLNKYATGFNKQLQQCTQTQSHVRLKPDTTTNLFKHKQNAKYHVGQLVWSMTHQRHNRPQWQLGIITKNLSLMNYEIRLSDEQHLKRHQNQLHLHYSSNTQSSNVDSLLDDSFKKKSQFKTTQSSHLSSPRYPRRTRKPPERYTTTSIS